MKGTRRFGLIIWGMSLTSWTYAHHLSAMKIETHGQQTTIMLAMDAAITPKIFLLDHPSRLVIDLPQTSTSLHENKIFLPPNAGIVRIRAGHPQASVLRWVYDLRRGVKINTTHQTLSGHQWLWRVVLMPQGSMASSTRAMPSTPRPTHTASMAAARVASRPLYAKPAQKHTWRDIVIVLDPGHGGRDPGAIGPRHTQEKNVVLSIARLLKQKIDAQPGMHAVLTRQGDYYVGLRQRLMIARRYNADVFVAIHADAAQNHDSFGASVYALSQRGATSEAAHWLAAKENYSELGGVKLSRLHDQSGIIRTVLIDLSQTATIGASLQMGSSVLDDLNHMTSLHHRGVEQARFVVLKSPDIPSILIETGFISNPHEEINLLNQRYQQRLTQSIFAGLKRYFWSNPPHGTQIEYVLNERMRSSLSRG